MIVSIHQPNFFPWLGYFDKILKSDVFVFLDSVSLPKKGGTWSNRVKILEKGCAKWITANLDRQNVSSSKIYNIEFSQKINWRGKIEKTLAVNYSKAKFFKDTMDFLLPLIQNPENNISSYNKLVTLEILKNLEIKNKKVFSSFDLNLNFSSCELLAQIVSKVNGSTYLSGDGSLDYFDKTPFRMLGINVKFQNFIHPTYFQNASNDFIPGLSIIDALMNLGFGGLKKLIL